MQAVRRWQRGAPRRTPCMPWCGATPKRRTLLPPPHACEAWFETVVCYGPVGGEQEVAGGVLMQVRWGRVVAWDCRARTCMLASKRSV